MGPSSEPTCHQKTGLWLLTLLPPRTMTVGQFFHILALRFSRMRSGTIIVPTPKSMRTIKGVHICKPVRSSVDWEHSIRACHQYRLEPAVEFFFFRAHVEKPGIKSHFVTAGTISDWFSPLSPLLSMMSEHSC